MFLIKTVSRQYLQTLSCHPLTAAYFHTSQRKNQIDPTKPRPDDQRKDDEKQNDENDPAKNARQLAFCK